MSAGYCPKVIVFGLSANPPTGFSGHAGIVRWASERANEVWVVPVYRHAFHEKRDLAPYEHRRAMARLAFESIPRVTVKDTEKELVESTGGHIGTIDVMRKLMSEYPDRDFTLLLGADTYRDLLRGRWKESRALLDLVPIMVLSRAGVTLEGAEPLLVQGLDEVSSSSVRASRDLEYLKRALQPEVLDYIQTHRLYAFSERP